MAQIFYSTTCPTCCRAPFAPFRIADANGKVANGCVDHFHTGHLVTPSESARWHERKESKLIRAMSKSMRNGAVTEYAPN